MLASHFIAEELLEKVDNSAALKRMLGKFRGRYPEDVEFIGLCELYDKYLLSYDRGVLAEFKRNLKDLYLSRKRESSGGGSLPLSDRRHMREDRSRR